MPFTIIRHNVINDQAATQQTQVPANSLEIGRGSGNALLLDDLHISPRHAVIEYVDGRYVIKDLEVEAARMSTIGPSVCSRLPMATSST